jgi:hypothetical protein
VKVDIVYVEILTWDFLIMKSKRATHLIDVSWIGTETTRESV